MKRIWKTYSGYLFLLPYAGLFGTFMLLPLAFGLRLSFLRRELLTPVPPYWIGFGNYVEALSDTYFWQALWATMRFVLMAVPLTTGTALLVALGIARLPQRWQSPFRAAYFLPTMVSVSVAGILWRWFFNSEFGLFSALLEPVGVKPPWITDPAWAMKSIVGMSAWWTLGGSMIVLLAGLQHIPKHYYEAAAIDGAGSWGRFRHVTLPLLRPVLLFVSVMNIIGAFQVFGQTFMITRGGPEFSTRVLMQYVYETAFTNYRMGYGAAMSWLLFIVIAVFSIAQFRWMRERP
jgi:multiple sugar transport system permease protein